METTNYFTIMPMSQHFTMEPGESYSGTISVINPNSSTDDLNYKAYVAPYGVVGSDYTADLQTESAYTQMKKWIKIENPTGTVAPNGKEEIKFTVNVPKDAPGGGQYAAIIVTRDDKASSDESSVAVKDIFEMASLVYASVNGETRHGGEIKENNIPGFVSGAPITLSALITNTGNVHENATVIITATDFFTGNVIVDGNETENYYSELIMPETERFITRDINEGLPMLGVVHVEQKIRYNGTVSEESKNVIICPIWFLILIILTLAAIIAAIVHIVLKHRRKKAHKDDL